MITLYFLSAILITIWYLILVIFIDKGLTTKWTWMFYIIHAWIPIWNIIVICVGAIILLIYLIMNLVEYIKSKIYED